MQARQSHPVLSTTNARTKSSAAALARAECISAARNFAIAGARVRCPCGHESAPRMHRPHSLCRLGQFAVNKLVNCVGPMSCCSSSHNVEPVWLASLSFCWRDVDLPGGRARLPNRPHRILCSLIIRPRRSTCCSLLFLFSALHTQKSARTLR